MKGDDFSLNFKAVLLAAMVFASQSFAVDCLVEPGPPPVSPQQLSAFNPVHLLPSSAAQYQKYIQDTYEGLDRLRGPNGLVVDEASVEESKEPPYFRLKVIKSDTSPTNIGLDLIAQAEMAQASPALREHALQNIEQIMKTIGKEPAHPGDNLFYSWYATTGTGATVKNVSAVDNIHLALGFYVIAKQFPDTDGGKLAKKILAKMDFSIYYDPNDGISHGNLTKVKKSWSSLLTLLDKKKGWKTDAYEYDYFGSEARSIYSIGYALGLFKKEADDSSFVEHAVNSLQMERAQTKEGKILKTWDGAGFQGSVPEALINESAFSPALHESATAYGSFILNEGKRRGFEIGSQNIYFPTAYSAAPLGKDTEGKESYVAQAGNPELIATKHVDYCFPGSKKFWTYSMTVHAAMLGAGVSASQSDLFAPTFRAMERYKDKDGNALYHPGLGFSDGVVLADGVHNPGYGKVVNRIDSLDQLFFLAGATRATDPQGQGISANTLSQDPDAKAKLQEFYQAANRKLEAAPLSSGVKCPE
jgi:hypothetical protein